MYMIKELQNMLNNTINNLTFLYSLESEIITLTTEYFDKPYTFNHPLASVAWNWSNYDIWLMHDFVRDDTNTLFSIVVFDNNDKQDNVYAGLEVVNKTTLTTMNAVPTENEKFVEYFKLITECVEKFHENRVKGV